MLELYQAYADYKDHGGARRGVGRRACARAARLTELHLPRPRARPHPAVATRHDGRAHEEATGSTARRALPVDELRGRDRGRPRGGARAWGPGKLLLELYEKTTEPELWGPVFVIDYPAEVSPLARRHRDGPRPGRAFRAVVAGRELGNAFTELVDPVDQRARFEAQACARRR